MYDIVEKFVEESFLRIKRRSTLEHLKNTVKWIRKLQNKPSEALLIAAVSHDIERAYRDNETKRLSFIDKDYLNRHQHDSSVIIGDFLEQRGAKSDLVARVKFLVAHHEVGGDSEQNILKDADRISFFDRDLSEFIKRHIDLSSKESVLEKFEWNFANISSPKATEIARPMYEKAIKLLRKVK